MVNKTAVRRISIKVRSERRGMCSQKSRLVKEIHHCSPELGQIKPIKDTNIAPIISFFSSHLSRTDE
jgi:hypothetical protein